MPYLSYCQQIENKHTQQTETNNFALLSPIPPKHFSYSIPLQNILPPIQKTPNFTPQILKT